MSVLTFYKADTVARLLMVINSSINFLVYCAGSSQFQVHKDKICSLNFHVLHTMWQKNYFFFLSKNVSCVDLVGLKLRQNIRVVSGSFFFEFPVGEL